MDRRGAAGGVGVATEGDDGVFGRSTYVMTCEGTLVGAREATGGHGMISMVTLSILFSFFCMRLAYASCAGEVEGILKFLLQLVTSDKSYS
jgi:hypothetical protein